jgi:hypothetical protein
MSSPFEGSWQTTTSIGRGSKRGNTFQPSDTNHPKGLIFFLSFFLKGLKKKTRQNQRGSDPEKENKGSKRKRFSTSSFFQTCMQMSENQCVL